MSSFAFHFILRPDSPEDLNRASDEHHGCQFFAMKELHKEAELILCPYNYIFDVNIRNAMGIELDNAAVIIDEGQAWQMLLATSSNAF